MKCVAIIAAFFGCLALSSHALAGDQCTCRYKGQDVPVGGQVCLKTPEGPRVATCGFELNNTSWKFSAKSCDQVATTQPAVEQAMVFISGSTAKVPVKK